MQVLDLKGELANSKAGQAALRQVMDSAKREQAAAASKQKALEVSMDAIGSSGMTLSSSSKLQRCVSVVQWRLLELDQANKLWQAFGVYTRAFMLGTDSSAKVQVRGSVCS